jgi:hypothetical protein
MRPDDEEDDDERTRPNEEDEAMDMWIDDQDAEVDDEDDNENDKGSEANQGDNDDQPLGYPAMDIDDGNRKSFYTFIVATLTSIFLVRLSPELDLAGECYITSFDQANDGHAWSGTPEIDDTRFRSGFFLFFVFCLTHIYPRTQIHSRWLPY